MSCVGELHFSSRKRMQLALAKWKFSCDTFLFQEVHICYSHWSKIRLGFKGYFLLGIIEWNGDVSSRLSDFVKDYKLQLSVGDREFSRRRKLCAIWEKNNIVNSSVSCTNYFMSIHILRFSIELIKIARRDKKIHWKNTHCILSRCLRYRDRWCSDNVKTSVLNSLF